MNNGCQQHRLNLCALKQGNKIPTNRKTITMPSSGPMKQVAFPQHSLKKLTPNHVKGGMLKEARVSNMDN